MASPARAEVPQIPLVEDSTVPKNVVSLVERLKLRGPVHQPGEWDENPGFVGGFHPDANPIKPRKRPTEEDYERAKKIALEFVESPMEDLM